MSFVLLFAFAVHCVFSSSFLILEKHGRSYKLVEENIPDFADRMNLLFISERGALQVCNTGEGDWSLNRQEGTEIISSDQSKPTLLSLQDPKSPYIGSLSSGVNLLYVFYLYPENDLFTFKYHIAERAVRDFAEVAGKTTLTDPKTIFEDLYRLSIIRDGQPMSKKGITAVVVDKGGKMTIKYAEETLQLEGTVSTTITGKTRKQSTTIEIANPPYPTIYEFPEGMDANSINGGWNKQLPQGQTFVGFFDKLALVIGKKSDAKKTFTRRMSEAWGDLQELAGLAPPTEVVARAYILFGAGPLGLIKLLSAIKGKPFADYATIAEKMGIKVGATIGGHQR